MQGKWKKATTATVASAIIAAQAMMQVAAAGGTIDADVSTKSPVLRVVVPTTMAVSVDEFEMVDTGSQIFSDEFTMKNVSEIPVNVKVTSTADLGATVTLVSTKEEAQESTDTVKPAMWLAAVAAIKEDSGKFEYTGEGDKTVGALAGTEDNATAFATGDSGSTAVQNFYLQAATNAQYEAIVGSDAEDIGNGADYYLLTEITLDSSDADGVEAAAADKDVYMVTAAPTAGTAQGITKVDKGTEASSITWAAGKKVYEMGTAPVAFTTVKADNTGIYMYIKTATTEAGDAAAFRYAGALSKAKSGWSAASDLKAVEIKYDITGISTSAYNDIKDGLVYGYKAETEEAKPVALVSGKDNTDVVLKVTLPEGKTLATNFASVNGEDASKWGSFKTNVIFNTEDNTVTVKAAAFGFSSVKSKTTDHKYTFIVKDTEGTEYSTDELDLTP